MMLKYNAFIQWLNESAMAPVEWNEKPKYRVQFLSFLEDKNKELIIDGKYKSSYPFLTFKVSDISNLADIKSFIESDRVVSVKEPLMDVNAVQIPLTHLLKTGLFTGQSKTSTDTDTKEGMVVYYYYNQGVDILTMKNSEAVALVDKIPMGDLHPKAMDKLRLWLSDFDRGNRDQIAQWKSTGSVMSNFLASGYHLDRNEILTKVRDKARILSGLAPDNWCPGDVYLVDPSAKSTILDYVNNAESIGQLNLLFNDTFTPRKSSSEPMGSIVAVSLKQQAARLGRAKEFLKSISNKDTTYNLTKDELDKCKTDEAWAKTEISKYQQLLGTMASKSEITVHYTPGNVDHIKPASLSSKLAAIKLTYHLLTLPKESPEDLDNNLLSVLKFGLKQADKSTNPPYFKITGSIKGDGSLEFFHGGDTLELLIGGLGNKEAKLVILDSSNRLDIVLFYYVAIGDTAYEIRLRAATTGSKQAGLEFEGKENIGNIVEDPQGTKAKIDKLFHQRSSMK